MQEVAILICLLRLGLIDSADLLGGLDVASTLVDVYLTHFTLLLLPPIGIYLAVSALQLTHPLGREGEAPIVGCDVPSANRCRAMLADEGS